MESNNKINLIFTSLSENESFARSVIACFALRLNPSVSELTDIKTAVSEAVTNAIVHGYPNINGNIEMEAVIRENQLHIKIKDFGVGIEDVDKALTPFYTTLENEERSGMGFTIMQSFMDSVEVKSEVGKGTSVAMTKLIKQAQ